MTTSLNNCRILLSKEIGDYWSGTTTGAGSTTEVVDTALCAKANDWINQDSWLYVSDMTGDTYNERERKISSLDNTTGSLTVLAIGGALGTSATYEVHRLASPSDKRIALIAAAKNGFPFIHKDLWDETHVSGNWLKDGSFERWSSSSALSDWTTTTSTIAQTSTSPYYKHGTYSCAISTAAGSIAQSITNYDDLKFLAGKTVTFTIQAWCNTASCLRISVNDGTTQTYSSYHDGSDTWTEDNPRDDGLYVTQTIADHPTAITFTVHHGIAAATSYVDDARVLSGPRGKTYIGELGLAQNRPITIEVEPYYMSQEEPWNAVRGATVNPTGYLVMPTWVPNDRRLRIRGRGYLDFLTTAGVVSEAWTNTINIEAPQLEILIAEAALYLYTTKSMPNDTVGDRKAFQEMAQYWESKARERRLQFGMPLIPAQVSWSV